MALQIRRGLNQERLSITLLPGEVAYVTDYKATTKLITAVADVGDTVTVTAHGWASGQQIRYRGPTGYGLTQGTLYYVKNPTTNAFQLSAVSDLSTTVAITGTASGLNYPVAVGPRDADGNIIGTSVAPVWVGDGTTVGGVALGAWTLDDLYDVEIASDSDGDGLAGDNLANEQHLEYDASTQQWYNRSNMIIPGTLLTRSNVTFGDTGNETVTFYSPTVEAPNNLSVDSGTLYVDTANNRVGIGDTSPDYKLDVAGSIRATGDITIDGQDLISSTTTFNLVNTTATTVNTGGAATAYNIGHSSGTGDTYIRNDLTANQNADILGNLTVNGNTTLGNASGDLVTVNASEVLLTASQPFITFNAPGTAADGVNPLRGIRGNVTEDDYWFVGAGASGNDNGYLEISISDNAAAGASNDGIREAIVVRRYGGAGTPHPGNAPWGGAPVVDEMYLFNTDGYTTIPNRLGLGINPSAKLDVNGSAIVRGTNLTVEGTIQANGGSITSSQATLTINAGGQVTIDDNVTVTGNLTVNGTTTTVNSTTLTVDDKNIELGSVSTPSDTTANGGGITLKGTTDKTIIWDQVTGYWTFNQNISALGGYLGSIDVGIQDENGIYNPNDDLNLNAAGGDVRVKCDFVAEGELRTWDNQITFKSNVTGAPSEDVDIIVERGTSADTRIRWNETTDRWTFTNDGTNYTNLLVATDSPSFAGATLGNITVGVTTDNTITTTTGDLVINAAGGDTFVDSNLIAKGQLSTYDNIIVVNADVTGAPSDNGGLFVNRGSSADVGVRFNETTDRWETTVDGTNYINLPNQALDTDSEVQFSAVNFDSDRARINTSQTTTTSTTTTSLFTFGTTSFRTMKATVSIARGTDYQAIEVLITHNGTTAYMTQYGEIITNTSLATLSVDISGGLVRLRGTSASATSTTYTILAQVIA